MIGDGVGHVKAFCRRRPWLAVQRHLPHNALFFAFVDVPIIGGAADQAEIVIKAAIRRPVRPVLADMPFAGHERGVAGVFENLGNGHRLVVEITLVGFQAVF